MQQQEGEKEYSPVENRDKRKRVDQGKRKVWVWYKVSKKKMIGI